MNKTLDSFRFIAGPRIVSFGASHSIKHASAAQVAASQTQGSRENQAVALLGARLFVFWLFCLPAVGGT